MGLLVDVLLGTVVIAVPQTRLPLLAVGVGTQVYKALGQSSKEKEEGEGAKEDAAGGAVTLTFEGVSCVIEPSKKQLKNGEELRTLLQSASGNAAPGRLLALMGPSGSGKTTLLTALSGRVPLCKGMTLRGSVLINGTPLSDSTTPIGYVPQDDMFYSQMTVRETLTITAALRLPKNSTEEEREAAVEEVLTTLDLRAVADTVVGDKKTRGVSGGEKKRLSIACELLSRPSLMFLDEPTTGLDAFQALKVMEALKALTLSGHTVIASIHQPRSKIYDLFDDLLLLSNGNLLYSGPAENALAHFESLGHTCPPHHNPAEFLADVISIDNSSDEAAVASNARFQDLVQGATGNQASTASANASAGSASARGVSAASGPPLVRQVRMLFQRSWRQVSRDRATLKLRVATNIQSAVVFGCIWWRLRRLQISVNSRIGLLQVVAVYTAQTALFKTINLFAPEKALVRTERTKGSYGAAPYFISKVLADLPFAALYPLVFSSIVYPMANLQPKGVKFLAFAASNIVEALSSTAMGMAVGAIAPSTEAALVLGPALTLIFVVFGGLYTNQSDVPKYLRWVPACSGIKNGYDALCKNEFSGLELEVEGPGSFLVGEDVLDRQGFTGTIGESLIQQGRILVFYWWLTYCLLVSDKPKYQLMLEPEASTTADA